MSGASGETCVLGESGKAWMCGVSGKQAVFFALPTPVV